MAFSQLPGHLSNEQMQSATRPYDFSNIEAITTQIKQGLSHVDQREKSFNSHR